MYTMIYDIRIGSYRLGMLDNVEVHKSVELLADTAVVTLPAAQYNNALEVENKLHRGDKVCISFGYEETGLVREFSGWLQRISTDGGSIKLYCEDDLFLFRKEIPDEVLKKTSLTALLEKVVGGCGLGLQIACSYSWTYGKFVIHDATGYDVLKKIQEECGADIYICDGTLHVHPPGETIGNERLYDLAINVEKEDLTYRRAAEKKVKVVVKALLPDGTVKEVEAGSTGGERVEVRCPTSDEAGMKARGELEVKRRTFDGYEGSITGWLIPVCRPADMVTLHDKDYPYKDGTYFVTSVTTTFGKDGGKRKIDLGFRIS
ncbi:hypothetical protein E5358_04815 [Palleniella muris]|uniref:Uncharacterized protein n=1 Tax=Palleniella muris TaxID=3038145 RepID=A0AC61QSM7_9BACT|nr:hypothetical protein [Palleniella muris]TGX82985.1 hypothetical protein E5358_04815 [Palleniella muris]